MFQIIVKEKGVFTNVTSPSTKAKLRLLFEVAPLALLVEKVRVEAGSKSNTLPPPPPPHLGVSVPTASWAAPLQQLHGRSAPRPALPPLAIAIRQHSRCCCSSSPLARLAPCLPRRLQAGGASSCDGLCVSGLDVEVTQHDQRTQICYGSVGEVRGRAGLGPHQRMVGTGVSGGCSAMVGLQVGGRPPVPACMPCRQEPGLRASPCLLAAWCMARSAP